MDVHLAEKMREVNCICMNLWIDAFTRLTLGRGAAVRPDRGRLHCVFDFF